MPKVTAAIAALLLAVVLTGCADDTTADGQGAQTTSQRSESVDETPAEADEAEEPAAELTAEDEKFLDVVRGELLADTGIADFTDEQLIDAGHEGCEIIKAGTTAPEDIRLIEGEEPARSGYYMDTSAILFGAQTVYCPETIRDLNNEG